jgi:hypothetical protein
MASDRLPAGAADVIGQARSRKAVGRSLALLGWEGPTQGRRHQGPLSGTHLAPPRPAYARGGDAEQFARPRSLNPCTTGAEGVRLAPNGTIAVKRNLTMLRIDLKSTVSGERLFQIYSAQSIRP